LRAGSRQRLRNRDVFLLVSANSSQYNPWVHSPIGVGSGSTGTCTMA
jgi:hypothetical protein